MPGTNDKDIFRLKLEFESPPPGMPTSSKYMILVKPDTCKTIHDLELQIIRKFGYSKGATLILTLDRFTLPSTEEVCLLGHNDCIMVTVVQDSFKGKRRKKRKMSDGTGGRVIKRAKADTQIGNGFQQKHIKLETKTINGSKSSGDSKPVKVVCPTSQNKHDFTSDSSSDSSSLSDESQPVSTSKISQHLSAKGKPTNKTSSNKPGISATKPDTTHAPSQKFTENKSLAKCSASTKMEKVFTEKVTRTSTPVVQIPVPKSSPLEKKGNLPKSTPSFPSKKLNSSGGKHITFDTSSSDSSSESEMHVDKQTQDKSVPEIKTSSLNVWLNSASADNDVKKKVPKPKNESWKDPGISTNISTVFQNPDLETSCKQTAEIEKPYRNYSQLLPSTWPPRKGDRIGYKMLEMSQDYTPVISEDKEALVLEVLASSTSPIGVDSVKIERLWPKADTIKREGRFEMDLEEDDAEDESSEVILEWKSLLDAKLIE